MQSPYNEGKIERAQEILERISLSTSAELTIQETMDAVSKLLVKKICLPELHSKIANLCCALVVSYEPFRKSLITEIEFCYNDIIHSFIKVKNDRGLKYDGENLQLYQKKLEDKHNAEIQILNITSALAELYRVGIIFAINFCQINSNYSYATEPDIMFELKKLKIENQHLKETNEVLETTVLDSAGIKDKRVGTLEKQLHEIRQINEKLREEKEQGIGLFKKSLEEKDKEIASLSMDLAKATVNFENTMKEIQKIKTVAQKMKEVINRNSVIHEETVHKLVEEKKVAYEKMEVLKKEWENLARNTYKETLATAAKCFRSSLAARDLGFLEIGSDSALDGSKNQSTESLASMTKSTSSLCSFDVLSDNESE